MIWLSVRAAISSPRTPTFSREMMKCSISYTSQVPEISSCLTRKVTQILTCTQWTAPTPWPSRRLPLLLRTLTHIKAKYTTTFPRDSILFSFCTTSKPPAPCISLIPTSAQTPRASTMPEKFLSPALVGEHEGRH